MIKSTIKLTSNFVFHEGYPELYSHSKEWMLEHYSLANHFGSITKDLTIKT